MSRKWSDRYPIKESRYSSHAVVCSLLGPGQGKSLLDVGCGSGAVGAALISQGWIVSAIEPNVHDAAAALEQGLDVMVGTLEESRVLIDRRFDAIVLGDVIEHTVDPLKTVECALDFLEPGGILIISVPNIAHLSVRILLALGRFNYTDRGILDRTHLRFFTRKTFQDLLESADLNVTSEQFTPAPIEEVFSVFQSGRALAPFQTFGAALARFMPSIFAYQFVVKVTKEPSR